MTIANNLSELLYNSESLYKQLISKENVCPEEALIYSSQLVKLRKQSDKLLKEFVLPYLNEDNYLTLSICRKNIYKSQSKLFKKIAPEILQSSLFHDKVSQVWARYASKNTPLSDFGRKFALNFPKDPITLEGLNNHLLGTSIHSYIKAYLAKKTKKAALIFNTLPEEVKIEIEQRRLKYVDDTNISHPAELKKAIDISQEKFHVCDIPMIHHSIDTFSFQIMKLLNGHDEIREQFRKFIFVTEKIDLKNDEEVRDYLFRFATHPFLFQALLSIELTTLKQAYDLLEQNEWNLAKVILNKLSSFSSAQLDFRIAKKKSVIVSDSLLPKLLNLNTVDADLKESLKELITNCELKIKKIKVTAPIKVEGDFYAVFTIDNANMETEVIYQAELNVAYEALIYALRKITISSNFLNREEKVTNFSSPLFNIKLYHFVAGIKTKLCTSTQNEYCQKKSPSLDRFTGCFAQRKTVEEFSIGNCGELSSLAIEYLSRHHKDLNFELVGIPRFKDYGDHVFLAINRDPLSDIDDPNAWGDKAVVLDCWTRMIYPASRLNELLENWLGIIAKSGFSFFSPYHFTEQKFKIITHNIMPYSYYKSHKGLAIPGLEESLNSFHSEQISEIRHKLALECLDILLKESKTSEIMEMLRSQLYFYLHSKIPNVVPAIVPHVIDLSGFSMKKRSKVLHY